MKERVQRKNKVVRIYAHSGFLKHVNGKVMCKVENTGNGYIAKFPALTSSQQETYVCLDYSHAALLYQALREFKKEL